MKQVVLDTNFILTAIQNKIDFIEGITFLGLTPVVPKQVISELNKIVESKKKLKFKDDAKLGLMILSKKKIEKIDLKNDYVDDGLIDYAEQNKTAIIATMDKELKSKLSNQRLVIRASKGLEIL